MHAIDLLETTAPPPLKPIYALHGEDLFLRRETTSRIRQAVLPLEDEEMSVTRFVGETAKLADVLDELKTLPFFSKRRLVIVENADTFVTSHRKGLEEYAEHPASAGFLVLTVKLWPSTTKLTKLVEKVGLSVECKGPNEKTLHGWLVKVAATRCHVKLDADASNLLVELVGPDVGTLLSEVEKLAVYVGKRAHVQGDDVARLVGAGRVETVWKMTEAASTGRGELALEHLDGLLTAGENAVGLLARLSPSLRKVHHAGQLRRRRVDHKEACIAAGIYPSAVEMTRRQHAHLGPDRVDRLPNLLLQADLDLKGGSQLTPRSVLERLIVTLASPRKD